MLLLKLLRPRDIPQRKKQWNWQVRWYNHLLRWLLPIYKRCAVSDTITIGKVKVVHTIRDYWYEQELQRFHIDIAQHMEKTTLPITLKRKRRSTLFQWKEALTIYADGKKYAINNADHWSIESEISGQVKLSTDRDCIVRTEFTSNARSAQAVQSTETPKPADRAKSKIAVKDSIPSQPEEGTKRTPQTETAPKTTKYRGFEENDIF